MAKITTIMPPYKSAGGGMFEGYRLCDTLKPSEVCLVVEQYSEGTFIQKFHEHVPKYRISNDSRNGLLRALVVMFSSLGPERLVHCYLNTRGRTPPSDNSLLMVVSYPEPGVVRTYCGTNTKAWSDQVIAPNSFRTAEVPIPRG
jgi:hypothetical protein